MSTCNVDTREMQNILPLTRAALENIIRFQLKGHDHAVKSAQLSGRDQHSERTCSHIHYVFRHERSIEIYFKTLFFSYSPYLSEKKQFLWPVQDCQ